MSEEELWEAVVANQNQLFYTASGLPFSYVLKKGRDGEYNRELIVDRRNDSKTIVWSSVVIAYRSAISLNGMVVERPKALGDIRGISYIYPLFYSFGIIDVPEKTALKMDRNKEEQN